MARVLPVDRGPAYDSERRVLARLQELDDDWLIFHNIKWQGLRRNRQGDGETDFALFHPSAGILVIEAKGGDIILRNGDFMRRYPGGRRERIDSPFDQAEACKRQLSNFLASGVDGLEHGPRVGRAVAFPDVRFEGDLGPAGPRAAILDANDLLDINNAIRKLVDYWRPPQKLTREQLTRIRRLLLPSVTVKRRLREEVEDAQAGIIKLTDEQYEVLDGIGGNRQALITGGAGTGKTMLAIERARRLADLGAKVLLVCYNRLLGDALHAEFSAEPNVIAGNLHSVLRDVFIDANMLEAEGTSQEWWDTRVDLFPEAAATVGLEVDAVIIDEGQDFRPGWWLPLKLIMLDFSDGWFYVFADEQQALFTDGWTPPFDTHLFTYRLTRNCRNTDPIAAKVAAIFGGSVKASNLPGPKPKFHQIRNADDALDKILGRLRELLREGIQVDQIQVLSTRDLVDRLRGSDVDGVGLVGTGEDGIAVDTIRRFKGREALVVLCAITNAESDGELKTLAYTGMSRAQAILDVFASREVMAAINWGNA